MKKLSTTSFKNNSGQALLVILLTMSVALTVVLSVSSRSVTDITTTTYEEDALRAFNAAEAGVEEVLITETNSGVVQIDSSEDPSLTYDAVVASVSPGNEHHYPKKLKAGEIATFWFVGRNDDGDFTCSASNCTTTDSLEFCWGEPGTASNQLETPAVNILVFYDDSMSNATAVPNCFADVVVKEYAFDPYADRLGNNNFNSDDVNMDCALGDYAFSVNIDIASSLPSTCASTFGCPLFAGVRMLYNDGPNGERHKVALRVGGAGSLPPQGIEIESIGEAGESTRKVKVVQGYPEPSSIFWGAIWGENSI